MLYGLLFLVVIVVAVVAGYVVASSIHIGPLRPPDVISRLVTATPTPIRVDVRILTPSPTIAGATVEPAPTMVVIEPTQPALPAENTTTATPSSIAPPLPATATATLPNVTTTAAPAGTGTPSVTPAATGFLLRGAPTPTRSLFLYVQDGAVMPRPDKECYVGAVFGWVRDEKGEPLPGVQVKVADPWGNEPVATTKQPPDAGYYDVILGTGLATYYVSVVDSLGNRLSPVVEVVRKDGDVACWYQVDFRRTRAW